MESRLLEAVKEAWRCFGCSPSPRAIPGPLTPKCMGVTRPGLTAIQMTRTATVGLQSSPSHVALPFSLSQHLLLSSLHPRLQPLHFSARSPNRHARAAGSADLPPPRSCLPSPRPPRSSPFTPRRPPSTSSPLSRYANTPPRPQPKLTPPTDHGRPRRVHRPFALREPRVRFLCFEDSGRSFRWHLGGRQHDPARRRGGAKPCHPPVR